MSTTEIIGTDREVHSAVDRFTSAETWERAGVLWANHQKRPLVCCRVVSETHDVRTFSFSAQDGLPFSFEPGQFVTVSPIVNGEPLTRCYTISSPPTRPYTLSITVKRVPGGVVSNWLHDNMQPGMTLDAFGPSGIFTPTANRTRKVLYLSAGSGVTPLMAMTRAGYDLGMDRDVVFVHSARTPADIIFRNELQRMTAETARLKVLHVCESAGDESEWNGPLGRLSEAILAEHVPDYKERAVFTCGPAGYMGAVKAMLLQAGHDPALYHQESFDFGTLASEAEEAPPAPAADAGGDVQQSFTVRLARSGKTFTVCASDKLLAAAKNAGVAVASSCSQGICGTCKTMVLEGTVDMQHNGGIRQREIDRGMRLLCCSRPTSDLVLDL